MRERLLWTARQRRTWLALGAAVVATVLAAGDGRPGWTFLVAATTIQLAMYSMVAKYREDHPDLAEREAAKQQAAVDKILWRYERERLARQRATEPEDERH